MDAALNDCVCDAAGEEMFVSHDPEMGMYAYCWMSLKDSCDYDGYYNYWTNECERLVPATECTIEMCGLCLEVRGDHPMHGNYTY